MRLCSVKPITLAWETPKKKPIVCICIPHTSTVTLEWAEKVYLPLKSQDPRFDKTYQMSRGIPVDLAREQMVEAALKTDATHIFFQDSDEIYETPPNPNDAIAMLLNLNQPIISGVYRAKQAAVPGVQGDAAAQMGFAHALWTQAPGSPPGKGYVHITPPPPPTNLFTVDVTGLGCTLIKREVFEKVTRPWFPWELGGPSEDFAFYHKAKLTDPSFLCWIFSAVTLSHIGELKVKVDGSFNTLEM